MNGLAALAAAQLAAPITVLGIEVWVDPAATPILQVSNGVQLCRGGPVPRRAARTTERPNDRTTERPAGAAKRAESCYARCCKRKNP